MPNQYPRAPGAAQGDLSGGMWDYGVSNGGAAGVDMRPGPQGGGSQAPRPKSNASGLQALNEGIGLASDWRPSGYIINRNAGYAGGSYGDSQKQLDWFGNLANNFRANGGQHMAQWQGGVQDAAAARMAQMQGLASMQDVANAYKNMYQGNGPSLAALQLQRGLQQSQAAQASMAAGARGGGANLAAAQLAASTMAGQQAAATNEAQAQVRAQEQLAAMSGWGNAASQYGAMAGQMRGGDLSGANMGLAGYEMQQRLAQEQDAMRQRQQLAELQAQTGLEEKQGEFDMKQQEGYAKAEQESASNGVPILGSLLKGLSDERTKTDKKDASSDIDGALAKIRPMSYRYKDERPGTKRIGPMAQDLPDDVVEEHAGVKFVRMDKATGLALAGLARVSQRLDKIEGRKR